MRRGLVALVVALGACGSSVNFAGLKTGPRRARYQDRILVRRLPNGLRVALMPDTRTNLVSVEVRYEVGGADDPVGDSGLAHYLEHLLWEAPVRGHGGEALRDVSLDGNAMTQVDHTDFFATALDVDIERELELAARRLEITCDVLDDAVLARERDVVVDEIKFRSRFRWSGDTIAAAIWGPRHPYANGAGGTTFNAAGKPEVCAFLEQHYGPASATLVVTGRVDESLMDLIVARFGRIPSRAQANREPRPAATSAANAVVAGLEKPTLMVVFNVPPKGQNDAAVEMLDGTMWRLERSPAWIHFVAVGESARVLVAYAEVDDAAKFAELERAMKRFFGAPTFGDFAAQQQRRRLEFVADFDNLVGSGIRIAELIAHQHRLSRYDRLREIDQLDEASVVKLLDVEHARVVKLVPDASKRSDHHVAEVATALHHVDVSRTDSVDLEAPALPSARAPHRVVDYQLANGLRVWLAPDPATIAIDARLVISTRPTDPSDMLPGQAAVFLQGGFHGSDDENRVRWYETVSAPLDAYSADNQTIFHITGLALFGDWHVWRLAWTVVQGGYPWAINSPWFRRALTSRAAVVKATQPASAYELVARRLAGHTTKPAPKEMKWFDTDELESYRRSAYQPAQSTLIVSGNFDEAQMRSEIASLFGPWKGGATRTQPAAPAKLPPRVPSYISIPADDAATVEFVIAFAPKVDSPRSEAAAHDVLNEILDDRLRVIREGLGVSYGVYAHTTTTAIMIGGDVELAYAADAMRALAEEIERVRNGYPEFAGDFARARKRVLARALADPIGASARAAQLQRLATEHEPLDQPDRDLEVIRTLDLETVRALATRDLRPDRMIAALRGPRSATDAAIRALGIDLAKVEVEVH